ncbi:DUF924 family protein [Labrys okinawensis]|uniref:DUF924 family protein n=1 Tax=Labrys okinawensis TaxID=346911 RepID=UPI0039BCD1E2
MVRVSSSPEGDLGAASALVAFWREVGPERWFEKDAALDRVFHERFLAVHEAAAAGELADWAASPTGALALVLLLDQFPRNCFRDTPRMYATDAQARAVAVAAIGAGHDRQFEQALRGFFYLPFQHSEDLADQDRSVALHRAFHPINIGYAEGHRDIIRRFGRFPHRNAILGRATTLEEQHFLDEGGFAG